MSSFGVSVSIFAALVCAAVGSLVVSRRLPSRYRDDETNNVVRLAANIFVVTTSLVLGLMLNSAKNTFESVDRNLHSLATEIVLLDRTLRHYGPDAAAARLRLAAYLRQAIDGTWGVAGKHRLDDPVAELRLDELNSALLALHPVDAAHTDLLREARASFANIVQERWGLIDGSEGTIPNAFMVIVAAWLVLIFASFGYRAPPNAVVVWTLVVAAFLLAGTVQLLLDMDSPFSGAIQIQPTPLERAVEQIGR